MTRYRESMLAGRVAVLERRVRELEAQPRVELVGHLWHIHPAESLVPEAPAPAQEGK